MQTQKGKGNGNGNATEITTPMTAPEIQVEDQASDPDVQEHEATDQMTEAGREGAPVLQSVATARCKRIMANRLMWAAAQNPKLRKYLVSPSRKDLGLD